jgi:glucan phosphoethanolaminetransferase (alkaline phosphatase superfamily)
LKRLQLVIIRVFVVVDKNKLCSEVKGLLYSINYIYFGIYFLLFAALQVYFVHLVAPANEEGVKGVYTFYTVAQVFIEMLVMAFISSWLTLHKWKKTHAVYIGFTVVLFLLRGIDFILVRLMDLSAWHGLALFVHESFGNFIEVLHSSSIPIFVWAMCLGVLLVILLTGMLFFSLSEKVCRKKRLSCSVNTLFGVFFLMCSSLVASDIYLHFQQVPGASSEYAKALPWKRTLIPFEANTLIVRGYLKEGYKESPFQEEDSSLFALERKPDLFLFITESLRQDFLTQEVTPSLAQFRGENNEFPQALSNANATQLSWFSTFYAMHPFYWAKYKDQKEKQGSHSLALLKKMGYEVHVYSASGLKFYSMDKVLFGEERSLVDSLHLFREDESIAPCDADKLVVDQVCKDVSSSDKKGGRVFVMFLDSTHFDYSWPAEQRAFEPIHEKINYLKLTGKRDKLEKVKNRYRNSLHYVDGLFGSFRKVLEEKEIWDESVVVFTADHGESFNEDGNMFHASSLSTPQLQVPLYVKLGKDRDVWELNTERKASQMDIFPTFFHYILGQEAGASVFQGESLFLKSPKSYVVGSRYNASRAPSQFYIQSDTYKMVLDFSSSRDIFHFSRLKVHSIQDENGEEVPFTPSLVQIYFQRPLEELFGVSD